MPKILHHAHIIITDLSTFKLQKRPSVNIAFTHRENNVKFASTKMHFHSIYKKYYCSVQQKGGKTLPNTAKSMEEKITEGNAYCSRGNFSHAWRF